MDTNINTIVITNALYSNSIPGKKYFIYNYIKLYKIIYNYIYLYIIVYNY